VRVPVELGPRSYRVEIGEDILAGLGQAVAGTGPGRRALLVADGAIANSHAPLAASSLHAAGIQTHLILVPPGEASKSLEGAARLYDACLDCGLDRRSFVVALGGGVVGDLAGFVAATYMRGLPFVQVPTTLLAQVDSSVGGKVAVDHPRAKNLIGAFHQPVLVWCDVATLRTLPAPELAAGLAEAIKSGVLGDPRYYRFLIRQRQRILEGDGAALRRVVAGAVRIKARVVAADEREETGARAVLNLGHTLGHAIEAVSGYGTIRHGEAVAIGMVAAGRLALGRSLWSARWQAEMEALLQGVGLPVRLPAPLPARDLLIAMTHDKKAVGGALRWILPRRPGEVVVVPDVTTEEVLAVLATVGATP
jgi:3-dehydroquinate synthase